jgi:hypothetical protein
MMGDSTRDPLVIIKEKRMIAFYEIIDREAKGW